MQNAHETKPCCNISILSKVIVPKLAGMGQQYLTTITVKNLPHQMHGRRSIVGEACWPPALGVTNPRDTNVGEYNFASVDVLN